MSRYRQRLDCEGWSEPSGKPFKLACCDCGLVHRMVLISEDGKPIGIAAKRDNRATAARRRSLGKNDRDLHAPAARTFTNELLDNAPRPEP